MANPRRFNNVTLKYKPPMEGETWSRSGTMFAVSLVLDKMEDLNEFGVTPPEGAIGAAVLDGLKGAHAGYRFVGFMFKDHFGAMRKIGEVEVEEEEPEEELEAAPEDERRAEIRARIELGQLDEDDIEDGSIEAEELALAEKEKEERIDEDDDSGQ